MTTKSRNLLAAVAICAVAVVLLCKCAIDTRNKMVELDEGVSQCWAEVQNQCQRRYDLIPNLTQTVKGYAKHESEVFAQVAEARSRAGGSVSVDESVLDDPDAFAKWQKAQDELGRSLGRLLAVSESYPELKADQNFLSLQDELEGTENRIAVARGRFNDSARAYNAFIRKFPNSILADRGGFEKKQYFQTSAEALESPKVEF